MTESKFAAPIMSENDSRTKARGVDDFDEAQASVDEGLLAVRVLYCRVIGLCKEKQEGAVSV